MLQLTAAINPSCCELRVEARVGPRAAGSVEPFGLRWWWSTDGARMEPGSVPALEGTAESAQLCTCASLASEALLCRLQDALELLLFGWPHKSQSHPLANYRYTGNELVRRRGAGSGTTLSRSVQCCAALHQARMCGRPPRGSASETPSMPTRRIST